MSMRDLHWHIVFIAYDAVALLNLYRGCPTLSRRLCCYEQIQTPPSITKRIPHDLCNFMRRSRYAELPTPVASSYLSCPSVGSFDFVLSRTLWRNFALRLGFGVA